MKHKLKIFITFYLLVTLSYADEASFEKDRQAILSMAGDHSVGFFFKETMSLDKDYKIKPKVYRESAHEKVFIVRNETRLIELQHVLIAGIDVVKHWSQVWTYEDTEILKYQYGSTWVKEMISQDDVKGTWSQLVTQTDDSPRYESFGKWKHNGDSSSWTGSETRRPLPRREYKTRKDYDYIVAVNRHTVTPEGWYHEQDNKKQVDRDGKKRLLVREIGFNDYRKVSDFDFSEVDTYWGETKNFWTGVKAMWRSVEAGNKSITILKKVENTSLRSVVRGLHEKCEEGTEVTQAEIKSSLAPYINKVVNQAAY